jgi:hypothetical protein
VYNGSSLQTSGDLLPNVLSKLVIDNPTTVVLSESTTVTSELDLTQGILDTKTVGVTLTAPDGDSNQGIVRGTGMVYGALTRVMSGNTGWFCVYPLASASGGNAGVDVVTNSSVFGTVTISTVDSTAPNVATPGSALKRYWNVSASGFNPTGTELQFHYLDADVPGTLNENTMIIARYNNGGWQELSADFRDVAGNVIMRGSVPGFSVWTAAAPGAVPVAVSEFSAE